MTEVISIDKKYRGGKIKKAIGKKSNFNIWHQFYVSVESEELFNRWSRKKRLSISLFYNGLKKYNKTKEELFAIIYGNDAYKSFEEYFKFLADEKCEYNITFE